MTIGFPLLLIPLAICNILIFLMPGVSFAAALFTVPLPSGIAWTVTLSDALLALGILLLLLEVIKSARPGGKYFTDHFLALLVFGGAAAEFVLLPQFGTSTFFLLTLLMLVDVFSGIGLRARRVKRAVVVDPPVSAPIQPTSTIGEPQFTPAPAPLEPDPIPVAASVPARVEPIVAVEEPHMDQSVAAQHTHSSVEPEAPEIGPHKPTPELPAR